MLKPTIRNWSWYRTNNKTADVLINKLKLEKVPLNKYLNKIKLIKTNGRRRNITLSTSFGQNNNL